MIRWREHWAAFMAKPALVIVDAGLVRLPGHRPARRAAIAVRDDRAERHRRQRPGDQYTHHDHAMTHADRQQAGSMSGPGPLISHDDHSRMRARDEHDDPP